MYKVLSAIILLGVFTPVSAQTVVPIEGGWTFHRFVSGGAGVAHCVIRKRNSDGTNIEISSAPFSGKMKIAFGSPRWASIKTGEMYAVGLRFEPQKVAMLEELEGINLPAFREIYKWKELGVGDFKMALAQNELLSIDLSGEKGIQTIATFDLIGSTAALGRLHVCERNMKAEAQEAREADPFRN